MAIIMISEHWVEETSATFSDPDPAQLLSSVPPEMAAEAQSHGVIVPTMTVYAEE